MKRLYTIGVLLLTGASAFAQTNSYTQTNLVTNTMDPNMINPWGISRPVLKTAGDAHWWTMDQTTGVTTLYNADATIQPLVITIPSASGTGPGSPAGTTFLDKIFFFSTLDGTISKWFAGVKPSTPGPACSECHVTNATLIINHSAQGAVYTGVTEATRGKTPTLYAANSVGGVEAYGATKYNAVKLPAGAFTDPSLPPGYTPFGIQAIGSTIYVTFAKAGGSDGYVDAFNTSGVLQFQLQTGWFNQPWGITKAPPKFGAFGSAILVGNQGNGWIAAFDPTAHTFLGYMNDSTGNPIANPGLWGIEFGAGNKQSGPTNVLYLAAGGSAYNTGVFAAIKAN